MNKMDIEELNKTSLELLQDFLDESKLKADYISATSRIIFLQYLIKLHKTLDELGIDVVDTMHIPQMQIHALKYCIGKLSESKINLGGTLQ
jgi:hypothetical protein